MKNMTKQEKTQYLIIIAVSAALLLAAVLFFALNSQSTDAERLETGTYEAGISIESVDVSGLTIAEAQPLVQKKAEEMLEALAVSYRVDGETYVVSAYEMGACIDYSAVLGRAMLEGNTTEAETMDYPLAVSVDYDTTKASLDAQGVYYNQAPVDARITVETDNNESKLSCSGKLQSVEHQDGRMVDAEALAKQVCEEAVQKGEKTVIEVQPQVVPATVTLADIEGSTALMAEFTTKFSSSSYNRRYNIWKMASVVNGVCLQPGEEWSINEAAGPRTVELGWKLAPGITDGAYSDQAGGGICQVSTTLYNAVLRADMEIVARRHHSWPSDYVSVGLDATISTGGPDFVFKNPYEVPVYVIVTTDAESARTIKVSVYGPEMEYKIDYQSEVTKKIDPGLVETTIDPSLAPGTSEQLKPTKTGMVVNVYKCRYDKQTGEQVSKELSYTDTYRAYAGLIAYGPSPTPTLPVESVPDNTPVQSAAAPQESQEELTAP